MTGQEEKNVIDVPNNHIKSSNFHYSRIENRIFKPPFYLNNDSSSLKNVHSKKLHWNILSMKALILLGNVTV
jgi:hypothetical protein